MKIKSYYSDTVEAAIRLASVELGDDAVFLGSKKNETGDIQGRYEVTFAVLDQQQRDRDGTGETTSAGGLWKQGSAEQAGQLPAGEQHAGAVLGSGNGRPHWREFIGSDLNAGEAHLPAAAASGPEVSGDFTKPRASNPQAGSIHEPLEDPGESVSAGAGRSFPDPIAAGASHRRSASAETPVAADEPFAAAVARTPLFGKDTAANAWSRASGWPPANPARGTGSASSAALLDSVERLSSDIGKLGRWLENARPIDLPLLLPMGELLSDPILAEVYAYLLGNDVDVGLAAQLVSGLRTDVQQGAGQARVRELLGLRLQALCRTASAVGEAGLEFRTAAFVGPTGVGKTSALAKLAIRLALADRRRVHLLTLDPLRVGAVEQLQAYAGLAEIPLTAVSDLSSLPRLLAQLSQGARRAELVLIDTPGYGPAELGQARRLAECLSHVRGIDVHLVASVTAKSNDLRRSLERYRIFQPAKLLFTKLDETESYGGVLNEAVRTQLPLSFFSTGQRVPDDLVAASEPYLIDLLLNKTLPG